MADWDLNQALWYWSPHPKPRPHPAYKEKINSPKILHTEVTTKTFGYIAFQYFKYKFFFINYKIGASLVAQLVKNLPAMQKTWVRFLGQEDPLEKWQPTVVFLPGETHGQRSLAGYSSCGHKSQTQLSN